MFTRTQFKTGKVIKQKAGKKTVEDMDKAINEVWGLFLNRWGTAMGVLELARSRLHAKEELASYASAYVPSPFYLFQFFLSPYFQKSCFMKADVTYVIPLTE